MKTAQIAAAFSLLLTVFFLASCTEECSLPICPEAYTTGYVAFHIEAEGQPEDVFYVHWQARSTDDTVLDSDVYRYKAWSGCRSHKCKIGIGLYDERVDGIRSAEVIDITLYRYDEQVGESTTYPIEWNHLECITSWNRSEVDVVSDYLHAEIEASFP